MKIWGFLFTQFSSGKVAKINKKMPKTIKEARSNLAKAIVHAKIAKQIIGFITREGRMRLTEDEVHGLKDLTLILGNDTATTDSFLGEYSRESFGSVRFSVRKTVEKSL